MTGSGHDPADASGAPRPRTRLRVATFNIHHGVGSDGVLDLGRTAAAVAALDADVVALQEVDRFWGQRSAHADQAGDLASRLGMHLAYGASLERAPRPGDDHPRQYGSALLSRHPVLAGGTTLLPRRRGEQRSLLDARITTPAGSVRVLVTHLQNRSRAERRSQARAIARAFAADGVPLVLLGDLNARPRAREVRTLTRYLVDAWVVGGAGAGPTYPARAPGVRIDYVLVSPGLEVVYAHVPLTDASDHRPVVADLRVADGVPLRRRGRARPTPGTGDEAPPSRPRPRIPRPGPTWRGPRA